ncbi:hypothetical protein ACRE_003650 [Hapsidospora chrysogenum ATCC 11550]|uniref:Cysteine-rich transmembrane CYSTM domain-containing protein n=1 Tax=Hapsidospora chrysogenum (strain ATCC 11550 / CBS 779.69 / DSM 880 / IAM 14645 / JCM 23072 / IMI 49137) TaxID=857340 RepID=A0A086TH42_HAPC1|nr:hypothetical protein ACRE_003650 [Hapsidospora chrysogenum ATCC 11550]
MADYQYQQQGPPQGYYPQQGPPQGYQGYPPQQGHYPPPQQPMQYAPPAPEEKKDDGKGCLYGWQVPDMARLPMRIMLTWRTASPRSAAAGSAERLASAAWSA